MNPKNDSSPLMTYAVVLKKVKDSALAAEITYLIDPYLRSKRGPRRDRRCILQAARLLEQTKL